MTLHNKNINDHFYISDLVMYVTRHLVMFDWYTSLIGNNFQFRVSRFNQILDEHATVD